ncbi:MAG: CoA-binding protein [Desulfobacterales bacterium]
MNRMDLERFFYPRHIAVVGVSSKNLNFGGSSFLAKLKESSYSGKLYPINPKIDAVLGHRAFPSLSSLPESPDMAMLCVPAMHIPDLLEECARVGTRHIHILTSGFKEVGTPEGKRLEALVASISRENGLFVMGPNCMGPYCPSSGLTAWGAIPGLPGNIGIISQSGGITQRLTEYLFFLGIGVEKAVSIGNAAVLNSMDYLEYMGRDEKIDVIGMYLEGINDGRKLLNLAREICRSKPVVIWKGGESETGAAAASSHTGAMAGKAKLWEAFFQQTGVARVRSMDEWADVLLAFSCLPQPAGKGVFVIGGGGGHSVTNTDACIREGLNVPALSEKTMAALRETVPKAGSIAGNPLDDWQVFADPDYLGRILGLAYQDPSVDIAVVDRLIPRKAFHTFDETDPTPRVIEVISRMQNRKPTVFTVDSEGGDPDLAQKGAVMRAMFCHQKVPAFPTIKRAAGALKRVYDYYRSVAQLRG